MHKKIPLSNVLLNTMESLNFIRSFDSEFLRFVESEFDSEFNEKCRVQQVRFRISYLVVGDQIIKMATTRCIFDQNTSH